MGLQRNVMNEERGAHVTNRGAIRGHFFLNEKGKEKKVRCGPSYGADVSICTICTADFLPWPPPKAFYSTAIMQQAWIGLPFLAIIFLSSALTHTSSRAPAGEIFCTLFSCRISLCSSTWALTCLCCPSASPLHTVLQLFLWLCVHLTCESIWLSIIHNTSVTESLFNAVVTHEKRFLFGKTLQGNGLQFIFHVELCRRSTSHGYNEVASPQTMNYSWEFSAPIICQRSS